MALPSNFTLANMQQKKQQQVQKEPSNQEMQQQHGQIKQQMKDTLLDDANQNLMLTQYMTNQQQSLVPHRQMQLQQVQDKQQLLYQRLRHEQAQQERNSMMQPQLQLAPLHGDDYQMQLQQQHLRQQQYQLQQQNFHQNLYHKHQQEQHQLHLQEQDTPKQQHSPDFPSHVRDAPAIQTPRPSDDIPSRTPLSQNPSWISLPCRASRNEFIGVTKEDMNWRASLLINGEARNLGLYGTEEEAARIHDIHAISSLGINAVLNFPHDLLIDSNSGKLLRVRDAVTGSERDMSFFAPFEKQADLIQSTAQSNKVKLKLDQTQERKAASKVDDSETLMLEDHLNCSMYTAANEKAIANALNHCLTCVYDIIFSNQGTLGINLRPVQLFTGARSRRSRVFIGLEVIDVQAQFLQVVVQPRDIIISVNATPLFGHNSISFENSLTQLSMSSLPKTIRFARVPNFDPLELEIAIKVPPCAVFDVTEENPARLVTAQIGPGAPPFFILNPPTRGIIVSKK